MTLASVETLAREYEAGTSLKDLAAAYGSTPRTVKKLLAKHGVRLRTMAEARALFNDPARRLALASVQGEVSSLRPDLGPCILFTGCDNGNGYGQFAWDGHNGYAHRFAWEQVHGPIPEGMTVDHLCMVRMCVNVEHMELVDGVTNYLRGVAARKVCNNKLHELTEDNIIINERGSRLCKACLTVTKRRNGHKRTNIYKGIPNRSVKYDPVMRDELVAKAVNREISVRNAAEKLGCTVKYMDALVRAARRARESARADLS